MSKGLFPRARHDDERLERGAIPNSLARNLEDRLSIPNREKGSRGVLHSGIQKILEQLRKHFSQSLQLGLEAHNNLDIVNYKKERLPRSECKK